MRSLSRALVVVVAVFAGLAASDAAACQTDADCPLGVRCEREVGEAYGTCTGAPKPPPKVSGDVPPPQPKDAFRVQGRPCRFDVECQPGGKCRLQEGNLDGYCVKQ